MTTKFKRTPDLHNTAESFIEAASNTVSAPTAAAAGLMPWVGKRNDKQTEVFNVRLTEEALAKLKFIGTVTPFSMQAFVQHVLLPAIDNKLDELINPDAQRR